MKQQHHRVALKEHYMELVYKKIRMKELNKIYIF